MIIEVRVGGALRAAIARLVDGHSCLASVRSKRFLTQECVSLLGRRPESASYISGFPPLNENDRRETLRLLEES
jgi:hypothetical protein